MRWILLASGIFLHGLVLADEAADARKRWESSPHGPMLERILPPTFAPAELPEPGSEGARLTLRLPNASPKDLVPLVRLFLRHRS